jgi:O-antigen/teichoic acid export membrane protein
MKRDFLRKMMSNSVAQGLNFGSRWLLNLALARHMLETEFGIFSFVYMLANLFFPTIAFGVNFYLIHHAASQQNIRHLLSSLIISVLVSLVLLVGLIFYSHLSGDALPFELLLLSLLIGASWALNQALFCYLKGRQDFASEIQSQLFNGVAMLVLVGLIWFGWTDDTATVLLLLLLISLVPLAFGIQKLWPEFASWWRVTDDYSDLWHWRNWQARLSYAWHDMFAIYLTNIPFIFLALFSTLTELGQFRKAFILFMPVTLLPVVFSQVLLAKLSAQPTILAKRSLFLRNMLWSLPLLSLPYFLLIVSCPWLYPWLLNEALTTETATLTSLVVGALWVTLLKTYFEVWITALGLNHWRAISVTVVAILGSAAYMVVNHGLNPESAAWIFMGSNALAVLFLVALSVRGYTRELTRSVR